MSAPSHPEKVLRALQMNSNFWLCLTLRRRPRASLRRSGLIIDLLVLMRSLSTIFICIFITWPVFASNSENLGCKSFFKMVRRQRPSSIAQTLRMVRRVKPDYLANHTFAYNSNSLHGSSMEYPRALVYGDDAKMILSFNGHPSQDAYERMEIMCFNDKKKTFEFRDLAFPKEASKDADLSDIPASERDKPFVLSGVDGHPTKRCSQCHQTPSRPNWEPYFLWPGMCGADDDFVGGYDFETGVFGNGRAVKILSAKNRVKCGKFLKNNRLKGRYGILPKGSAERPNLELTQKLAELNGERIAAELVRDKDRIMPFKYRLAHALFCESSPMEYMTLVAAGREVKAAEANYVKLVRDTFQSKAEKTKENIERYIAELKEYGVKHKRPNNVGYFDALNYHQKLNRYGLKPVMLGPVFPNDIMINDAEQVASLRRILEPLGYDLENWSTSLNGSYHFHVGSSHRDLGLILQPPLIEALYKKDGYKPTSFFESGISPDQIDQQCDEIKELAAKEFKKYGPIEQPAQDSVEIVEESNQ